MDTSLPGPQPSTSAADASLRRLAASVAVAHGLATTGRPLDLAGLDGLAGLLCAQILDLDRDQALALRPGLAALETDVAGLIALLETSLQ